MALETVAADTFARRASSVILERFINYPFMKHFTFNAKPYEKLFISLL